MKEIKDKKVVIVGASSGIGKALSAICTQNKATVFMASRSIDKIEKARQGIEGNTRAIVIDMLDENSVKEAFEEIGVFDYLIVTAVADETKLASPIVEMSTQNAQRGMEKFWGTFFCCREAAKRITKDGSIVLTSSVSIFKPSKSGSSVLNAASAAVAAFGRAFAVEIAPVRVNIIAPGVVNSGVWDESERDNLNKWATDALPVKHLGDPQELAQAYYSVMTNTYMTGSISMVDGGLMLI